ncbi:DUF3027 domain-containing protein [Rhodococcus sp. NCIMB 12038]|uniref:DUF3027 domain-containing protein n=1 Tax=Rhodococcus sp. NCIMB 12038 TaxID=933800 RepID=UPI000B3CEE15|nr:DUF3027 domain-containing protein [Rhodococcus sp. NCIMB 12038]OUS94789.1 hypothetical protein CA951_15070 [Rhodococcus sp. NCIMB 12038]
MVRQTGGVSVASSDERAVARPVLTDAVELARTAVVQLQEGGVGDYLGVTSEDECAATHRFVADLPGYRGWQWAVVVAADPGSDRATVSELALLPGPDALVAPEWIPWDQRIRPGDLSAGDLLAPPAGDPRLVPGYVATGDPEIDDAALELGLGRKQVMSLEGRLDAAQRWHDSDYGPDSEMAKAAPSTCGLCGFYLPLAGSLHGAFGVCGNEMAADGHVVDVTYGCGAHSDTLLPTGAGSPQYDAYDDGAVEVVERSATETEAAAAVTDAEESASTS